MIAVTCPNCRVKLEIYLNNEPISALNKVNCCDCLVKIPIKMVGKKIIVFKTAKQPIKPVKPTVKITFNKSRYALPQVGYRRSIYAT